MNWVTVFVLFCIFLVWVVVEGIGIVDNIAYILNIYILLINIAIDLSKK